MGGTHREAEERERQRGKWGEGGAPGVSMVCFTMCCLVNGEFPQYCKFFCLGLGVISYKMNTVQMLPPKKPYILQRCGSQTINCIPRVMHFQFSVSQSEFMLF